VKSGPGDVYVQSATLNGKALDRVWISHDEVVSGGVLRFRLGPQPNEKWGVGGILAAE
jgi:putative alpha-1,2-mannosidase